MTNGTATFIAVCLGVLALEMTLVLAVLVVLVLRVTAAVQAVERVALQIEDKFASLKTSWMRVLQGAGGLLSGFMSGRKHARDARDARAREEHDARLSGAVR